MNTSNRQRQDSRQEILRALDVDRMTSADAPMPVKVAGQEFENAFGVHFETYVHFSKAALAALNGEDGNADASTMVSIVSQQRPEIHDAIGILTRVANMATLIPTDRAAYRGALIRVLELLPNRPSVLAASPNVLCVGIEREGRVLAEALGWLPAGRSIHPDAKRIPYQDGLLVGLSAMKIDGEFTQCMIIDGAIASGATIVATMLALLDHTSSFRVFSVHGTAQGVRAIERFARLADLDLQLTVGHVSGTLNKKYYAVFGASDNHVVVGDLGDTIVAKLL